MKDLTIIIVCALCGGGAFWLGWVLGFRHSQEMNSGVMRVLKGRIHRLHAKLDQVAGVERKGGRP